MRKSAGENQNTENRIKEKTKTKNIYKKNWDKIENRSHDKKSDNVGHWKIKIFWEGPKDLENLSLSFDITMSLILILKNKFFNNLVAFSQYLNFKSKLVLSEFLYIFAFTRFFLNCPVSQSVNYFLIKLF